MNSNHAQFLIPEGMAGKQFGGKKAAPFKPGGGRKQTSPRDAKGNPKKK